VTPLRPLLVSAGTSARRAVASPGGLVTCVGFYIAVIGVLGSLWRVAAAANGGQLAGYSGLALSWYIAASEAVTVSLNIRMIEEIGDDIGSGAVVVELLRPASVLAVRVASEVGRALPRMAACVVVGLAVCSVVAGVPPAGAVPGMLLALPAMVLAVSCNVVAQHAFAGAAFWVRDARSTWFLYQKLVFLLGGMLLPLEVLPDSVERVARLLPFMAMAYAPARLASGHAEPVLLVVQVGWLVVLGGVAVAVFAAGEQRLQAVGG
jgi:ABC-2 type transport system permease protein